MKQKKVLLLIAIVLVVVMCASVFAACNKDKGGNESTIRTYRTYASSFATSWNVFTAETNDQSDMYSYSSSGFYEFDYKFDADGNVVDGEFTIVPTMASDYATDVTSEFDGEEAGWGIADGADSQAWYIPIRKNMTWDDGTPIVPADWVYSMKEQLNPLFQNYRADSYYAGTVVLHNAKDYLYQGQSAWYAADTPYTVYSTDLDDKLVFTLAPANSEGTGSAVAQNSFRNSMGFPASYAAAKVANYLVNNYLGVCDFTAETAAQMEGKTLAQIKADATLNAAWEDLIGWWQTLPNEELDFFVTNYTWPTVDFDNVGIKAVDDGTRYGIIVILDDPLVDNETHFCWGYDFGGNWLVKQDVYDACKVAPAQGSTIWTSTYGTSVATSPSYGPYKLTTYQTGKMYEFTKNDKWFGYSIDALSKGCYETDVIHCELIEEWDTAWMAFQKGELSAIGMDVKIADQYKTSQRAYFTPDDYVNTVQIQSSIITNATDGNAKEILNNIKFREALSLAFDRVAYAQQVTTASLAGYGLFNSMHYYDVQNGGVYRNTDIAKQVICDAYGVDVADYDSLEEAYAAVTGYNVTRAKQLVAEAIAEEIAKGTITATDKLSITYGSSVDSEAARRPYNFIKTAWATIFAGTQFAGEGFEFSYDGSHGDEFANDFKDGDYEVLSAGWNGAAWDPFFFITAYISDQYRYAQGWDPTTEMVTITVPGIGEDGIEGTADDGEGNDFTKTFSATTWYDILNGEESAPYNMGEGVMSMDNRLYILGGLEKCVLKTYYSIPVTYFFSAAIRSFQIEALTDNYNTFMAWGGVKYYSYNYTDAEWAKYVSNNGGTLNYK